jgi:hypothetical protein
MSPQGFRRVHAESSDGVSVLFESVPWRSETLTVIVRGVADRKIVNKFLTRMVHDRGLTGNKLSVENHEKMTSPLFDRILL